MSYDFTIIGARGYVGSALRSRLLQRGAHVWCPDKAEFEHVKNWRTKSLIYCAGYTADFAVDPAATVEAHAGLLSRILKEGNFQRLVYLSSTRLYDLANDADTCLEHDRLTIAPTSPRSLYDFSKGLGETLSLNFSGGRGCVARLSCVFDGSSDATGFLPELIRRAQHETEIELMSSPHVSRDYIFRDDVVEALISMASTEALAWPIVNICSGQCVTNAEIASVFREFGRNIRFQLKNRSVSPQTSVSALHSLGIKPRAPLSLLKDLLSEKLG